jgi:hypothetical protein
LKKLLLLGGKQHDARTRHVPALALGSCTNVSDLTRIVGFFRRGGWRKRQPVSLTSSVLRGCPLDRISHRRGMCLALTGLLLLLKELMALASAKSRSLVRPAKDEWGVYDPEQAGIAALLARLDKDAARPPAVAAAPTPKKDVPEPAAPNRPTLRDAK